MEKGQVRFFDVSFIEAKVRHHEKERLRVAVELTDFSVYYNQGVADSIAAEMKEGKSEVVCDQGQLWKVSKDKKGIVTRDRLTRSWTDWVDYWAVDFDYESRPEIIHEPRSVKTGEPLPDWKPGDELVEFVPIHQGSFLFENEWQSFRTRKDRNLELVSASHEYPKPGRYIVAVKVIDIFGNDTMTLVPVSVG